MNQIARFLLLFAALVALSGGCAIEQAKIQRQYTSEREVIDVEQDRSILVREAPGGRLGYSVRTADGRVVSPRTAEDELLLFEPAILRDLDVGIDDRVRFPSPNRQPLLRR